MVDLRKKEYLSSGRYILADVLPSDIKINKQSEITQPNKKTAYAVFIIS